MKPLVVLVGYMGTGKEEATKHLKEEGYASFSGGDVLREIVGKLDIPGFPADRPNLVKIANILRAVMGGEVLMYGAKKLRESIENDPEIKGLVVDSLRNPAEVELLKEMGAFVIEIAASPETRLGRIRERTKLGDPTTMEGLTLQDEIDMGIGQESTGQNIAGCVTLADVRIENEGTVAELGLRIDEALASRGLLEGIHGVESF